MAIDPDHIDALVTRLMDVLNSDEASSLETMVALLVVVGAANQRARVHDHELRSASESYDRAVGGILRRQVALASGVRRSA
jgi:hypothetical protein